MPLPVLALVGGLLAPLTLPSLPEYSAIVWWLSALVLSLVCSRLPSRPTRLAGLFVAGACWTLAAAQTWLNSKLPASFDTCDLTIQGRVTGLPDQDGGRLRFDFRVSTSEGHCSNDRREIWTLEENHRLRLSAYRNYPPVSAGDSLILKVRLRSPRGSTNPGGFDYEAWLALRKIVAVGYVRDFVGIKAEGGGMDSWREDISGRLAKVPELDHAGHIRALLLADHRGLTQSDWEVLRKTGTVHLLIVSGLHISLVALLGGLLGSLLGGRAGGLRSGVVFASLFALGYALLAGFGIAAQRACLMVAIFTGFSLLNRRIPLSHRYLYTLLAVLLIRPLAPLAAGFWLSFGAVLVLLTVAAPVMKARWLWRLPLVQLMLSLLLLPLLAYWQGSGSLLAPLANLFAVPLLSLLILPCLVASLLIDLPVMAMGGQAGLFLHAADWLLGILMGSLDWLAQAATQWHPPRKLLWLVICAGLLAVLPLPLPLRGQAVLLWVAGLTLSFARTTHDFRLVALDVGQGLSVLIQSGQQAAVYDTGAAWSGGFDAGRDVTAPALGYFGVAELTHIVVSHDDLDHAGGLASLKSFWPTARLVASQRLDSLSPSLPADCRKGYEWQLGQVQFEAFVLLPESKDDNDLSCVLSVSNGAFRVLLPGDISFRAEDRWLSLPSASRVDLLVAAHHGSSTSSSTEFLRRTRPDRVLYSAGWRNRFGHPSAAACRNAEKVHARLFNTAVQGALEFLVKDNRVISTRLWRCQSRRWWRSLNATDCSASVGLIQGCDY